MPPYSECLMRDGVSHHEIEQDRDIAILPRRKAGQIAVVRERAPVMLTRSVLENYFGMPLNVAAKELVIALVVFNLHCVDANRSLFRLFFQGICATAVKKVCR